MRTVFCLAACSLTAALASAQADVELRKLVERLRRERGNAHYAQLLRGYQQARTAFFIKWRKDKKRPQRDAVTAWLPQFVTASGKLSGKEAAVPLLTWIALHDPSPMCEAGKDALQTLVRDHARSPQLGRLIHGMRHRSRILGRGATRRALGAFVQSPHESVAMAATYMRGILALSRRASDKKQEAARADLAKYLAWRNAKRLPRTLRAGDYSVELYDDRAWFEARLAGAVHVVDFEDVDTSERYPVGFAADRYEAGKGIVIRGTKGQFVDREFEYPEHFIPSSGVNMFAPGPTASHESPEGSGGKDTWVTFSKGGLPASVAGFGLYFLDADHPETAASGFTIEDAAGKQLGKDQGFRTPDGGKGFRGMVVVDAKGELAPRIAKVHIVNAMQWPAVDGGEGAALDDFVFSLPVAH